MYLLRQNSKITRDGFLSLFFHFIKRDRKFWDVIQELRLLNMGE